MSASQESQAGPSSQQEPTHLLWNRLPSIKILRPPQGRYSQKVDERCFTYCSQSIHGRISQNEPWCRTFCIRKVFNHEVNHVLSLYEQDPRTHAQNVDVVEVGSKYPLPPEGQRAARFFGSLLGSPSSSSSSSSSSSQNANEEHDWHAVAGTKHADEQKYWKEGWYMWMSKSRWAAQEKMDTMRLDLEGQAEWQSYKDKVMEEWTAYEQGQMQAGPVGLGDSAMEDHSHGLNRVPTFQPKKSNVQDHGHDPSGMSGPSPPFPDSASESLLVELPPSLPPLDASVRAFFAPSLYLLDVTRKSIESGDQTRFAKLVWEKAQTKEPYELVGKLLKHTWNFWTEDGDQDNKDKKGS